jgi:hypothetical protein
MHATTTPTTTIQLRRRAAEIQHILTSWSPVLTRRLAYERELRDIAIELGRR